MGYYDNEESYKAREMDYDLGACLEYNAQSFSDSDIKEVLAVWEGEHDGDDWRWILALNDGRYVFLQGGCDYTGWDCQSWATSVFENDPITAAKHALGDVPISQGNQPYQAGTGHMLNMLGGDYMKNANEVMESLLKQIERGKNKTWRELSEPKLGMKPIEPPF